MPSLTIGQAAEQTGVTPDTLRYYERRALLPAPGRSPGGYRQYADLLLDALDHCQDSL